MNGLDDLLKHLRSPDPHIAEIQELIEDLQLELLDDRFIGRDHRDLGTYNRGCRGPLCRKANRDYGRERYRKLNGVDPEELHKPTVRTKWDAALDMMPTSMNQILAS